MAAQDRTTLGVNIVSGEAWIGLVECPDTLLLSDPLWHLARPEHMDPADALHDFVERFREELRRVQPAVVGVARPRLYGGWKYADALRRVSLESAIMLAASAQEVPFESVKQEDVFKALGAPPEGFPKASAKSLGIDPPKNWSKRALAFGTAVKLAKDRC